MYMQIGRTLTVLCWEQFNSASIGSTLTWCVLFTVAKAVRKNPRTMKFLFGKDIGSVLVYVSNLINVPNMHCLYVHACFQPLVS